MPEQRPDSLSGRSFYNSDSPFARKPPSSSVSDAAASGPPKRIRPSSSPETHKPVQAVSPMLKNLPIRYQLLLYVHNSGDALALECKVRQKTSLPLQNGRANIPHPVYRNLTISPVQNVHS